MRNLFNKCLLVAFGAAATVGLTACSSAGSSASGGSGTSNITISGAISSATTLVSVSSTGKRKLVPSGQSVDLSSLQIYVIYTSSTGTVGITQASVNSSTGAWSFSVPSGSQINAIVRNTSTLEVVGTLSFVNPDQTDIDGNPKSSTVQSFSAGVSLGTLQLNSDGKFEVDVTSTAIAAATGSATEDVPSTRIDFSGAWTAAAYSGTMPTGYETACAVGSTNCHGPTVGDSIYLIRISGKKFTYSGGNCATWKTSHTGQCLASDGTVDSTIDLDAASIWGGASAIAACGYKMGFAAADARAGGNIDVDPATLPTVNTTQMLFGNVVWSTDSNFGGDGQTGSDTTYLNDQAWMRTGAASTYPMQSCTAVTKTGTDNNQYTFNVCKGTLHTAGTTAYGANYGGGCVDSANKPVKIFDWSALNTVTPSCHAGPTFPFAGMSTNICSYSSVSPSVASAASFSCTGTYGTYTTAALTTSVSSDYISSWDTVSAGAPCQAITDALQRYRCYANDYYQHQPTGGCLQDYSFNWDASSAANFVVSNNRNKPKKNFLTNIVNYSPDGSSWTLEDHEGDGAQVDTGTGSVFCHTDRTTLLKGTKITATKMLVELNQSVTLKDTLVSACVAAATDSTSNGGNGSQLYQRINGDGGKSFFYLNK